MRKVEERAIKISLALKEWYKLTKKYETTPEEIMPFLYKRHIYTKDNRNDALQLRKDLRELYKTNKLDLIEEVEFQQKAKNKYWYFKNKA